MYNMSEQQFVKLSVQLWVPCGLLSATCVALFLCYVVGLKLCASIVCYGWVEIILALFPGSHTPSFHYLQYEKQGGGESLVRFCA